MKVKQIIIKYDNGNVKGYNLNGFLATFKDRLREWLIQRG